MVVGPLSLYSLSLSREKQTYKEIVSYYMKYKTKKEESIPSVLKLIISKNHFLLIQSFITNNGSISCLQS